MLLYIDTEEKRRSTWKKKGIRKKTVIEKSGAERHLIYKRCRRQRVARQKKKK